MKDSKTKKSTKPKIVRKQHEIDASGLVLGRLATKISTVLMGKNKVIYMPHIDMGDSVIIKNVKNIKITGSKLDQKMYYRHSGYPGGLKTKKMGEVFANDPKEVLRKAVYNMLPKNKLRKERMKRLKFV